jgi:transcriptional regulator with XRE-family HTH domain
LTFRQAATLCGVHWRTYLRWEYGETLPGGANLLRLARALRVPPASLVAPEAVSGA